jgi:hypothetical protein
VRATQEVLASEGSVSANQQRTCRTSPAAARSPSSAVADVCSVQEYHRAIQLQLLQLAWRDEHLFCAVTNPFAAVLFARWHQVRLEQVDSEAVLNPHEDYRPSACLVCHIGASDLQRRDCVHSIGNFGSDRQRKRDFRGQPGLQFQRETVSSESSEDDHHLLHTIPSLRHQAICLIMPCWLRLLEVRTSDNPAFLAVVKINCRSWIDMQGSLHHMIT